MRLSHLKPKNLLIGAKMDRYNYSFNCDEDQALLDMFNFFDDVGLPDHMDSEAYESLQQKFFANVPA